MGRVVTRHLEAGRFEGSTCLAVTDTGEGQVACFLSDADADRLMTRLAPSGATFRRAGMGLVVRLPRGLPAFPAETDVLAGCHAMLALRTDESAARAAEWLSYHAHMGAGGALIFVRGPGDAAVAFAAALEAEPLPDVPVLVVSADLPLGRADAGASWHAPLAEEVLYEALRYRYLAQAASVTALEISDFLLPGKPPLFQRLAERPAEPLMLRGRDVCAGIASASAADHIYVRRSDKGWRVGWCAAPGGLPEAAVWRQRGVFGVRTAMPPATFARLAGREAGGPDEPGALIEDYEVSRHFTAAFGRTPGRRPPAAVGVPRRPVAIVTTMKNEGPYIVDWIAHHRVVGVEDFLVYTNDCSDGTEAVLEALGREAGVMRRDNPYRKTGRAPQRAAFRAAHGEDVVRGAAWLLPLDVDEYLNIHVGAGTLADLFAAVPEATVLSVPWRLFGSDDVEKLEDRPVVGQFRCAAPDYAPAPFQAWGVKTLFRQDGAFGKIGVHAPRDLDPARAGEVVWLDATGRSVRESEWDGTWRMTPDRWGYDLCQINHYAVRSAEAFLIKRERGRTNHTEQEQGLNYWFRMNFNGPEERSIDRYAARVAVERARLMALPGVAAAHGRAVAWHRERAAKLREDPDYAALWREITGDRLRALSRRLSHLGTTVFYFGPEVIPDEVAGRPVGGDWSFTVPLPKDAKRGGG